MKKILIITRDLQTNSGVGRYSLEMVRALRNEGYVATVLVEQGTSTTGAPEGVVVHAVLRTPLTWVHAAHNALVCWKHARAFTIVHAFEGWPYVVYAYVAVLGTKKLLYMTAHGTYAVAPLMRPIKRALLSLVYKRAAKIFCVSAYTEARIHEYVPSAPTQVVHSATSVLPGLSAADEQELERQYPLGGKGPIFLTIGQIKGRKGQLDTLMALALLKEEYPNFLYVIIGSGALEKYTGSIRAYAAAHGLADNVLIISDSRDDRVPVFFYNRCDLFLLNANSEGGHFEGFGLVILEAGQYGKPAIGSLGSGIEDAIQQGYNGYLVPQRAHAEIAERVRDVMRNYETFSKNARDFAARFTWEKTARAYAAEYP